MKINVKTVLLTALFISLFANTAKSEISFYTDNGAIDADIAHAKSWVEFYKNNLKCFNQNISVVTVSATRNIPSNYVISDKLKHSSTRLNPEDISFEDNRFIVARTNRRYKPLSDSSAIRLYLADPRVTWAEQLSTCPEQEPFTISGAGINNAQSTLRGLTALPDAQTYLGLMSAATPMEYFMSIENDKNDCQTLSYITELLIARTQFNPKSAKDSSEEISAKLEQIWSGQNVKINGYSSPEQLALEPTARHAIKMFSEAKRNSLMLKAGNLKMALNPSKANQSNLLQVIVSKLKSEKWVQILQREQGNYGVWHNITIVNGEETNIDGDSRIVLYFYNSQEPTKLSEMSYSSREQAFFSSQSGKLFTKLFLWLNTNK